MVSLRKGRKWGFVKYAKLCEATKIADAAGFGRGQTDDRALLNPADSFVRLFRTRGWGTDTLIENRIQNAIGQKPFRQAFDFDGRSMTRQEDDFIGLVAECRLRPRNPVHDQQIEIFLVQFLAAVVEQVPGFRAKADEHVVRPFP